MSTWQTPSRGARALGIKCKLSGLHSASAQCALLCHAHLALDHGGGSGIWREFRCPAGVTPSQARCASTPHSRPCGARACLLTRHKKSDLWNGCQRRFHQRSSRFRSPLRPVGLEPEPHEAAGSEVWLPSALAGLQLPWGQGALGRQLSAVPPAPEAETEAWGPSVTRPCSPGMRHVWFWGDFLPSEGALLGAGPACFVSAPSYLI